MVGRRQDEDAFVVGVDAVHFGEQLVDDVARGGMALQAAFLAQRVNLVEEEHAGRVAASRLKYLTQVSFALAYPHVEHVGQTDGDELRAQFARRGPRDVGLAATRRAVKQQTSAQSLAVHL